MAALELGSTLGLRTANPPVAAVATGVAGMLVAQGQWRGARAGHTTAAAAQMAVDAALVLGCALGLLTMPMPGGDAAWAARLPHLVAVLVEAAILIATGPTILAGPGAMRRAVGVMLLAGLLCRLAGAAILLADGGAQPDWAGQVALGLDALRWALVALAGCLAAERAGLPARLAPPARWPDEHLPRSCAAITVGIIALWGGGEGRAALAALSGGLGSHVDRPA